MNITKLIDKFLKRWPDASYGPGHVVLDDLNLEVEFIDHSIELCFEILEHDPDGYFDRGHTYDEIVSTLEFLQVLKDLIENGDYNPELDMSLPGYLDD